MNDTRPVPLELERFANQFWLSWRYKIIAGMEDLLREEGIQELFEEAKKKEDSWAFFIEECDRRYVGYTFDDVCFVQEYLTRRENARDTDRYSTAR